MHFECPANVVTLTDGALACHDGGGATVAWIVTPDFDVSMLDPAELGGAWAAGFVLVGISFAIGRSFSLLLEFIRRG